MNPYNYGARYPDANHTRYQQPSYPPTNVPMAYGQHYPQYEDTSQRSSRSYSPNENTSRRPVDIYCPPPIHTTSQRHQSYHSSEKEISRPLHSYSPERDNIGRPHQSFSTRRDNIDRHKPPFSPSRDCSESKQDISNTRRQSRSPPITGYIPLSEIRRKRKAEEAAKNTINLTGDLGLAFSHNPVQTTTPTDSHSSDKQVDPAVETLLKSIGFDFELSKQSQEAAAMRRRSQDFNEDNLPRKEPLPDRSAWNSEYKREQKRSYGDSTSPVTRRAKNEDYWKNERLMKKSRSRSQSPIQRRGVRIDRSPGPHKFPISMRSRSPSQSSFDRRCNRNDRPPGLVKLTRSRSGSPSPFDRRNDRPSGVVKLTRSRSRTQSPFDRRKDRSSGLVKSTRSRSRTQSPFDRRSRNHKNENGASCSYNRESERKASPVPIQNNDKRRIVTREPITRKEFESLTQKSAEEMKRLASLDSELSRLRRLESELMRKKRREKDGHNDPVIVENSRLQQNVVDERELILKMINKLKTQLRLHAKDFEGVDVTMKQDTRNNGKIVKQVTAEEKVVTSGPSEMLHYVYRDVGKYWCEVCNLVSDSLSTVLEHLHSCNHIKKIREKTQLWVTEDRKPAKNEKEIQAGPIKGVEFMVPATAFYCSLCLSFSGDSNEAQKHLKSREHHVVYEKYVSKFPMYEGVFDDRMKYAQHRKAKEEERRKKEDTQLIIEQRKDANLSKRLKKEVDKDPEKEEASVSQLKRTTKTKTASSSITKDTNKRAPVKFGLSFNTRKVYKAPPPTSLPQPTAGIVNMSEAVKTPPSTPPPPAPEEEPEQLDHEKEEDISDEDSVDRADSPPSLDDFLEIPAGPVQPLAPPPLPPGLVLDEDVPSDSLSVENGDAESEVIDECD